MTRNLALTTLALTIVLASCSYKNSTVGSTATSRAIGDWHKIETTKDVIEISAKGGSDTITLLNYPSWIISSAIVKEGDQLKTYTAAPEKKTPSDCHSYLTSHWLQLSVPKEDPHQLIINCMANEEPKPRTISIRMASGDAFCTIKTTQLADPKLPMYNDIEIVE